MRLVAIILLVTAFVITAILGIVLAFQVQSNADLVTQGFIGFLVVAPIFLVGIYIFVRSNQTSTAYQSETELQRQLTDTLLLYSPISFSDLAKKLNVDLSVTHELVRDMVHLQVFNGYVNWNTGIIAIYSSQEGHSLTHCKRCKTAITMGTSGTVTCSQCQTEYFAT